jgi:hypothetical protein
MTGNSHDRPILALHLRPQRLGFAVLKSKSQLLDWGVKTYREPDPFHKSHLIQKRIEPLLAIHCPAQIVTNFMPTLKQSKDFGQDDIVQPVRDQAGKHSAQLVLIDRAEVRRAFSDVDAVTKMEIAAYIARLFPELAWKLPPSKKMWESEHYNMAIFDAIALVLAYLAPVSGVYQNHVKPDQRTMPG